MFPAVHAAVSRGFDRREERLCFKPIQQKFPRRAVIGCGKAPEGRRFSGQIVDDQIRAAQTDAIDLPGKPPPRRFAGLIDREPDAR